MTIAHNQYLKSKRFGKSRACLWVVFALKHYVITVWWSEADDRRGVSQIIRQPSLEGGIT